MCLHVVYNQYSIPYEPRDVLSLNVARAREDLVLNLTYIALKILMWWPFHVLKA